MKKYSFAADWNPDEIKRTQHHQFGDKLMGTTLEVFESQEIWPGSYHPGGKRFWICFTYQFGVHLLDSNVISDISHVTMQEAFKALYDFNRSISDLFEE